jgi:phosphonate transport system substrate-binding protein
MRKLAGSLFLFVSLLATPAGADPLIMGVFPRLSAVDTTRSFQPLARHLSEITGREVRLETAKDFETFWNSVSAQRYDLVHFNQYHYLKSHKMQGYQVIVKNREQGQSTLAASLVVRADSPIRSIADLKGKRVIFGGDRSAMQAYVGATYLLRSAGLKSGDYQEDFAKNPPNAAMAVFFKQADAAGAGDHVLEIAGLAKQVNTGELRYLATGEQMPHLPWAVKHTVSSKLRQQIQAAMLDLSQTAQGKAVLAAMGYDGFAAATDREYDKHRQIVREVLGEDY